MYIYVDIEIYLALQLADVCPFSVCVYSIALCINNAGSSSAESVTTRTEVAPSIVLPAAEDRAVAFAAASADKRAADS